MEFTISKLRKAMQTRADERRIYRATRHLGAHMLRDMGLEQDHYRERAYRV